MHIYSLGPKLLTAVEFVSKPFQSCTNWCAQTLDFSQFLTAITWKLWRHLATNMRT